MNSLGLLEQKHATAVAIENILFATDFSEASEAALPYVTALSLRYGSNVHVAHVLSEVIFLRPGAPDPAVIGSIYEDAHSAAQERIQALAERLRGFPRYTYLRHGDVFDELRELIREKEIDLVIVGTHGRTGLGKLVMGSIAEEIFRQASCPVLTVGPRVPANAELSQMPHNQNLPPIPIKFRQILYTTNFKPGSERGAAYAVSLAREFRARLALVHVIEDYGDHLYERPGRIEAALRRLERVPRDTAGLRYQPEFLADYGVPAERILETAAEHEADLIVLGVQPTAGHIGASTHFGGSTAHRVVVGTRCPVLTVRG